MRASLSLTTTSNRRIDTRGRGTANEPEHERDVDRLHRRDQPDHRLEVDGVLAEHRAERVATVAVEAAVERDRRAGRADPVVALVRLPCVCDAKLVGAVDGRELARAAIVRGDVRACVRVPDLRRRVDVALVLAAAERLPPEGLRQVLHDVVARAALNRVDRGLLARDDDAEHDKPNDDKQDAEAAVRLHHVLVLLGRRDENTHIRIYHTKTTRTHIHIYSERVRVIPIRYTPIRRGDIDPVGRGEGVGGGASTRRAGATTGQDTRRALSREMKPSRPNATENAPKHMTPM